MEQARAAEAWQPLHSDPHDDSFDWPILYDELGPTTKLSWLYETKLGNRRLLARATSEPDPARRALAQTGGHGASVCRQILR
jgi:hypothetical protein